MKAHGPPGGLDADRLKLRSRLARAHGHLHGILDMIDDGRSNEDILHQVHAVRAALSRATTLLLDDLLDEARGSLPVERRGPVDRLRAAIKALA